MDASMEEKEGLSKKIWVDDVKENTADLEDTGRGRKATERDRWRKVIKIVTPKHEVKIPIIT